MKRVAVAIIPVVFAVALYAFFSAVEPTPTTYRYVGLLARAIAAVGCLIGALQFDRTDYLRRAWGFLALAYGAFFTNALIFGAVSHGAQREISTASAVISGLIVVLGNASTITGAVLLSRAWSQAGLALGVSATARRAVAGVSLLVGLVVAGPAAYAAVMSLLSGNVDALIRVASAVGDIVTLAVLGPILLTAVALRGGSLAWPWALLVVGTLGWLFYDATLTVVALGQIDRTQVRAVEETLRMFACGSLLAAGLLQVLATGGRSTSSPSRHGSVG